MNISRKEKEKANLRMFAYAERKRGKKLLLTKLFHFESVSFFFAVAD